MDSALKILAFRAVRSLGAVLLVSSICAQGPIPAPTPDPAKTTTSIDPDSGSDRSEQRLALTGDWGGLRTRLKERGIEMTFSFVTFGQGVASGGLKRSSDWSGKLESRVNVDLEKLSGLKHWSAAAKFEYRFGGPALTGIGAINAVNTDMRVPASEGSVFAITTLNFTRVFELDEKNGRSLAVSLGRFDTLDIQEKFFGGAGLEKFFNSAHIGPMTGLRQVPNITNGVGIDYTRDGESFISFGVLDPNDHSTNSGLDNLFGDGVTLAPVINFPTKWFGKSGRHSFSYTVTTKKYTPFDAIRQITLPGQPTNVVEPKRGSWSMAYVGRQYIVERSREDGWGVFTQVSFADRATSPVTKFFDIGLGGNGIFKGRQHDDFGLAYAYSGLSSVLTENLNLATLGNVRPHAEHQFEGFYNLHITPWLRLTGDLQIIRPVVRRADTAVIPAVRLEVIF